MKTYDQLLKEFGARICTLNTGGAGIRAGIHTTCKEVAGDRPVLDFIASDETVDRYDEVIKQDGWELDNFMGNPVIPDCHNYGTVANILGRDILPKDQQVQDGHLCTRIEFAVDNPMGLLAYKMSKGGFIKSMSVGFIPLEWVNGNAAGQPARTYTKSELLEKSLVVVPANPGATIGLALKSGAIERADLKSLADFLKEFCSKETDPAANGGTSGAGVHDVRLLQLARELRCVLKK
jgi:HK97 family phage prohead protease